LKLLIVLPRQSRATGNYVTATRFAGQLTRRGWQVRCIETGENETTTISSAWREKRPQLALLLHAWRSGAPWLATREAADIPFAVLMTGTDLNRDLDIPERARVIRAIHRRAAAIIVQNHLAIERLLEENPCWVSRLRLLPPGIELGSAPCFLRERLELPARTRLLLHPASIRPVKGNLELLQMSHILTRRQPELRMVFCGPILDRDYGKRFLAELAQCPWASYAGEIPREQMPSAMDSAELVLNNSHSEGVANALVEAAVLGRPILARDIPGNRAVVRPGENGLLYDDADDFRRQLQRLLDDPHLRQSLGHPAPLAYDAEEEGKQLETILEEAALRV